MSTLQVTNIQATGETASRAVSGVAAAWVNFNGSGTISIRDSQGVPSLIDVGTGNYVVNFTSSMASINYSAIACGENDGNVGHAQGWNVNSWALVNRNNSVNSLEDETYVSVSIHGDLA